MPDIKKILVDTEEKWTDLLNGLRNVKSTVWFDCEGTSAKRWKPDLVGFQFGFTNPFNTSEYLAHYVPVWHNEVVAYAFDPTSGELSPVFGPNLAPFGDRGVAMFAEACILLFENPKVRVGGHNPKFDFKMAIRACESIGHNLQIRCRVMDTMMQSWLLETDFGDVESEDDEDNPRKYSNHGLKDNVRINLGLSMKDLEEICPLFDSTPQVPVNIIADYGFDDVILPPQLAVWQRNQMTDKMKILSDELDGPLTAVLAHMETSGVYMDLPMLAELDAYYLEEQQKVDKEIFELVGQEFDIGSNTQTSELLYDTLRIWDGEKLAKKLNRGKRAVFERGNITKKRPEGTWPVREQDLKDLVYFKCGTEAGIRVAEIMGRRRTMGVLRSTFTQGLTQHTQADGRVYPNYFQHGTVTGRFASKAPNLQNIPKRSEESYRIRKAFTCEDGWMLVGADYSQLEMRLQSSEAKDKAMMAIFLEDKDPHQTAADLMGVSRSTAKSLNYLAGYGGGASKAARNLRVDIQEAQEFIDAWYEAFSNVRKYKDWVIAHVKDKGYIDNAFGLRRSFNKAIADGSYWQNRACNFPIQSFAAVLMKIAMRNIYNRMVEKGWLNTHARMLLQVHDELLFEVKEELVDEFKAMITYEMENAVKIRVPLKVDAKSGKTWYDCH